MKASRRLTDQKRASIIQVAIAEFCSNGFGAASMDNIATYANVSKRTVYNHFSSKKALFDEVIHQLWASRAQELEPTYCGDRPIREQLRELLLAKMRVLNDPNFLDLTRAVTATAMHSPKQAQHRVNPLSERDEGFASWIRAAQADGKLKAADPYIIAQQVKALLHEFAFWPQIIWGQPPLSSAMQQSVVEAALNMLLASYEVP